MRVFIADDEQGIVELIKHLITVEKCEIVGEANNGLVRCTKSGNSSGNRDHRYYDAADDGIDLTGRC